MEETGISVQGTQKVCKRFVGHSSTSSSQFLLCQSGGTRSSAPGGCGSCWYVHPFLPTLQLIQYKYPSYSYVYCSICVVAVGGDGTVLSSAHFLDHGTIPLLGINSDPMQSTEEKSVKNKKSDERRCDRNVLTCEAMNTG